MIKRKPSSKKCKSTKKTIKEKYEPVYITLNLHNCNTSKIYNRNRLHSQPKLECKKGKPAPPPPKPKEPKCPEPCPSCIPRRGELVINGGFENKPDQFLGWIINAGVGAIKPQYGDIPHQGHNAVRLGSVNTRGLIYQDVPGICPGMFYQLNFFLSAATKCGNKSVFILMEFLDQNRNRLHNPVLEILVPEDSLTNETFTLFINATWVPAPPETRFARISFSTDCAERAGRFVHLDDVSLIAI
ncbi:MAG: hypothetical protein GXY49_03030 [Syntrophomonadaceae bacterium]|nr:hypothetical protein [Syntrophomonadaceae bacterium]